VRQGRFVPAAHQSTARREGVYAANGPVIVFDESANEAVNAGPGVVSGGGGIRQQSHPMGRPDSRRWGSECL